LTEGVCRDQQRHVQSVLRGDYDNDGYFGVIYTTDRSDNIHEEWAWEKANPNWGVEVAPVFGRDCVKLSDDAHEVRCL
jgi:phage terminase large subunit-like protein